MKLILDIEGETFPLACDTARAPATLSAIARTLPQHIDLHCPKIAGSHIYWPAPFVVEIEAAQDVMRMPNGAFFFWPERQMLEVSYAPLQSETASVTFLGLCEGDLATLANIGARVSAEQGVRPIYGTLRDAQSFPATPTEMIDALPPLAGRRSALWRAMPAELSTLMESRAIMHPAGPLLFAESETRGLHETLWWLRARWRADGAMSWRAAAALAAEKAAARLGGFCHLTQSAETLKLAMAALQDETVDGDVAFDEAILIAGRLSGWLDLLMPWHVVNEAMRAAMDKAA